MLPTLMLADRKHPLMELRHLRHFVAVAEELHFARAADRLGIEQSPLSHSIRNLESELGIKLFQRTTRRTWLTRAGTRFYAEAVRILERVDAAASAARNEVSEPPSRIGVGLAEHAAGEPFTRFLFELEHRHPPIAVDVREVTSEEASGLVADRILDLAVVLKQADAPGLRHARAWAEPLSLIVSMNHHLADRGSVSIQEIASQPFIMPHSGTSPGYVGQIEALFDRCDVRPAKTHIAKHQNMMVTFASTGRGLALLPESFAHGLTVVAVLPLVEPQAELVSWLLYREEDASDGVSFALEMAAAIEAGGELSSDADGIA